MKIKILFMAFMVAVASLATAQDKKDNKGQKMTAEQRIDFRVAKMQKSLMLDDEKAAEFAVLYKEYLLALAECRPEVVRGKVLTDAQIKNNLEARMDAREKALKVEKKYYGKLEKLLNAKQLQKVFGRNEGVPKGGKKQFAQRGKRNDKGFAKAPGRMGAKMNACKAGKAECKKTDCKNNDGKVTEKK